MACGPGLSFGSSTSSPFAPGFSFATATASSNPSFSAPASGFSFSKGTATSSPGTCLSSPGSVPAFYTFPKPSFESLFSTTASTATGDFPAFSFASLFGGRSSGTPSPAFGLGSSSSTGGSSGACRRRSGKSSPASSPPFGGFGSSTPATVSAFGGFGSSAPATSSSNPSFSAPASGFSFSGTTASISSSPAPGEILSAFLSPGSAPAFYFCSKPSFGTAGSLFSTTPSTATGDFPAFSLAPSSTSASASTSFTGFDYITPSSSGAFYGSFSNQAKTSVPSSSSQPQTSPAGLFTVGTSTAATAASTASPLVSSTSSAAVTAVSSVTSTPNLPSEITGKGVEEIVKDWNAELQERPRKFQKQADAIAEWGYKRISQTRVILLKLKLEVDKALQSMEEEAEKIYKFERGLLQDDEAGDAMYEQAEFIECEMEHVKVKIKTIINTLNNQGGELETTGAMNPLDVQKAEEFSSRTQKLASQGSAADHENFAPDFG